VDRTGIAYTGINPLASNNNIHEKQRLQRLQASILAADQDSSQS